MSDNSLAHLTGVLFSPLRTFQALAKKPVWVVAILLLIASSVCATLLIMPRIDPENLVRQQLERSGQELSEEQIDTFVQRQEDFGTIIAASTAVVGGPLVYLLVALVFWVVFKLVGGDFTFKTSFSITLHSFMPWVIATLLNIPVILGRRELDLEDLQGGGNLLASNLGAFAGDDTGPALLALLSSIDAFAIWCLVLLTLGYSVAGRTSRGAAAGVVLSVWAIYLLGKVGWVSAFG